MEDKLLIEINSTLDDNNININLIKLFELRDLFEKDDENCTIKIINLLKRSKGRYFYLFCFLRMNF